MTNKVRWRWITWLVALSIILGAVTPAPVTAAAAPASIDAFAAQLTGAFALRNYDMLQPLMGDPFRMAFWQSEGLMLTPTEAIEQLQESYLGPATAITVDTTTDLAGLLGEDPLSFWGPDVNAVKIIYIKGLSNDGDTEAMLIIADQDDAPIWAGMLIAPGGFTVAPPPTPTPTVLEALQVVNVRSGPGLGYPRVTALRRGLTVTGLHLSADGLWWRIICPSGISATECWITTDPEAVRQQGIALTPTPVPTPTATPVADVVCPDQQRVNLAAGSTYTVLSGVVALGQRCSYLLRALAGQIIYVQVVSPGQEANFAVTGVEDGQPLKRLVNEDRTWSDVLRLTQDYLVQVGTAGSNPVAYTLTISFSPLAALTPVINPARRIQFSAGQTTTSLSGSLLAGATDQYLVRALAGQLTTLQLTSSTGAANFAFSVSSSGQMLKNLSDNSRTWSGALPAGGDYLIAVKNTGPTALTYTLLLDIQPLASGGAPVDNPALRIAFAAGSTSTTKTGSLATNVRDQYLLRALAGQNMTIQLTSLDNAANFSLAIASTGQVLKSLSSVGRSASIVLPVTGDYLFVINNEGAHTVSYSLYVDVRF